MSLSLTIVHRVLSMVEQVTVLAERLERLGCLDEAKMRELQAARRLRMERAQAPLKVLHRCDIVLSSQEAVTAASRVGGRHGAQLPCAPCRRGVPDGQILR